ncbi:hypothetical protein BV22DRAFT_1027908 [Leucogyrophana mollusca]|uniref:Uncharacterized protein n=1 Tax=Leucogyrophana mollusca TaxID=85980 RepID=A0ACB8C1L1_9AGAM|nr:hypothetical protein BV22DRAFT_1027908 [Leucogyrophana mollusca]
MRRKVLAHLGQSHHHIVPFVFLYLTLLHKHIWIIPFLLVQFTAQPASAQVLINGQVFTQGLAIVDSPAPNSNAQAGNNLVIAIDVSGDGRLSQAAQVPGSTLATRFQELQIYLISQDNNFNATVSTGPGLLTQESGSTVKHLTWIVPQCTPAGQYNLTFYENSVINNQAYYSITPIPVEITSSSEQCTSPNQLLPIPQSSSPPPQSPWLASMCSSSSAAACTTVTVYTNPASASQIASKTYNSGSPITHSSVPSVVTVTVEEASPTTVTVVMSSVATLTETLSGLVVTTTLTFEATTTVVMEPSSSGGFVGYIPVNAATPKLSVHIYLALVAVVVSTSLRMLHRL